VKPLVVEVSRPEWLGVSARKLSMSLRLKGAAALIRSVEPPLHYTLIWDAPVLFISPPENNGHRFNAPGRPEGRAIKNFAAPRGPAKIRHFII
jgi:hypothetical protein